jgi:hypothetical protein
MPYNYNSFVSRARHGVVRFLFLSLLALTFAFVARQNAAAEDVTLAWDAPGGDSEIDGYRVHYGVASGSYTDTLEVGVATKATVTGLSDGTTYYFVVTAYNSVGESAPSNEASFTAEAPAFATGRFAGFLSATDGSATQGYFSMKVSATGTASGRVTINDIVCAWRGTFNSEGQLLAALHPGHGLPDLTLTLQFNSELTGVTGSLSDAVGTFSATLSANRAAFVAGTHETALRGRYTLAALPNASAPEQPQGYGYGTMTISKAGRVKIAGRLADGSRFSAGLLLVSEDRLALYTVLVGGGFISGELLFRDIPNVSDADATLSWSKPARLAPARFPSAQNIALPMLAARYQVVPDAPLLEGLRTSGAHATVSFTSGDLPENGLIGCAISLWSGNPVVVPPPNSDRILMRIAKGTGLMTGSFLPPSDPSASQQTTGTPPSPMTPCRFHGVLFQKGTGRGYGLFMGATQSGRVDLVPAGG